MIFVNLRFIVGCCLLGLLAGVHQIDLGQREPVREYNQLLGQYLQHVEVRC